MSLSRFGHIAFGLLGVSLSFAQRSLPKPVVIRDVTIIDCAGHAPRSGMSLLIVDGRIAAIRARGAGNTTPEAKILDGHGKYLIPGLWNMHVHPGAYEEGKKAMPILLAMGVTGVRDMESPLDDILRLRREVEDGSIPGPRMAVAGPVIQGPLPFKMPVFISVKDTREARAAVDMLQEPGGWTWSKFRTGFRTISTWRSRMKQSATTSFLWGTFHPPRYPRRPRISASIASSISGAAIGVCS